MAEPENIVIAQLRGLRKEMAAILENQVRDRQLILRIVERMDTLGVRVDDGFASLRREVTVIHSDLTLLENNLLSRHNEILGLARRVDDPEGAN